MHIAMALAGYLALSECALPFHAKVLVGDDHSLKVFECPIRARSDRFLAIREKEGHLGLEGSEHQEKRLRTFFLQRGCAGRIVRQRRGAFDEITQG